MGMEYCISVKYKYLKPHVKIRVVIMARVISLDFWGGSTKND